MSNAFEYRPKFIDIRVKKPTAKAPPHVPPAAQPCEHVGCKREGKHRAPKSREHANQFWTFCAEHVADYNKRWNYFSGMSDAELEAYRAKEEVGHRPTWTFRGGKGDRIAAGARAAGKVGDPLDGFGVGDPAGRPAAKPRRRMSRLQAMALEVLQLDENANATEIRTRYAELVKRWHPDSNGGDRGAETNLQRVLAAYQTLKTGGLV
jgi:DnaJ domain